MPYKYVVAVVRPDVVAALQMKLSQIGVSGIALTSVKGFGETKTLLSGDWLVDHTRLEASPKPPQKDFHEIEQTSTFRTDARACVGHRRGNHSPCR